MHDFKVGETVEYLDLYNCIITEIKGKMLFCDFYREKDGVSLGNHSFIYYQFKRILPPLTKEEKVNKKIKYLWNKSNYVKKNPLYAY